MQPEALLRTHSRSFTTDSLSYVISAISKCPNSRGSARGDYLQVLSIDGCNAASNLQQLWWTSGIQENIRSIRKKNKTFKNTNEPLAVKAIEGDGNCLFRALSYAITGEEDQHDVVRSLICDFIASTENIKVESMRQNKVWGTTTEMLAAANMFHVNVCVWAKFGSMHTWHIHRPKCREVVNESVYLDNKAGNHFNVVIRV